MKFLFVSYFHPEGDRVGATLRSNSVIRALRHLGHEVAVIGLVSGRATTGTGTPRIEPRGLRRVTSALRLLMRGLPSTGCEQLPHGWDRLVARTVAAENPDVLVCDMLWVWPVVEPAAGGRPIFYLEHNIEANVAARFARNDTHPVRKLARWWDCFVTGRFERRVWARARAIWAVSEAERLGRPACWQAKTFVVRNSLPVDVTPAPDSRTCRFDALFVGAVSFLPNRLALEWFCTRVWRDHKLGEAGWRLGVLGGKGEPIEAARQTGVDWLGYVDDLTPIYHATRAVVAPVFLGGGTKLKVIEALQYGLPLVAAPHAVEGLDAGHAIRVATTDEEWVAALTAVRATDTTPEGRQNRAFYLKTHDWRALAPALEASLRPS